MAGEINDWIDSNYLTACAQFLSANADYVLAVGDVQYSEEGENARRKDVMWSCTSPNPVSRVLEYYRSVLDNSAFYGVTRREFLAKLPIHRTMGSLVYDGESPLGEKSRP